MKEFVFNFALGLNLSPFASSKKESATAAAIIGGVGLAGSLYSQYKSLQSQADANVTNMQINREQLAAQRYLYDQQRADERFLVNQAYERNLPKNQVKNLREAGINPAFAMENGSFGVQQAQVGSAPSAPSVGTPHAVQPLNYEGMGIAFQNAANFTASQIQTDKENARADEALKSDKSYKQLIGTTEFINALTKAKEAGVNEKFINSRIEDMEKRYNLDQNRDRVEHEDRQASLALEERRVQVLENEQEISKALADSKIRVDNAQIKLIAQNIEVAAEQVNEIASHTRLNSVQKELILQQKAEQVLRNKNLPKSLHNDNAIQVATYNQIKAHSNLFEQQAQTEYWNTLDASRHPRTNPSGTTRPVSDYLEDAMRNGSKIFKK